MFKFLFSARGATLNVLILAAVKEKRKRSLVGTASFVRRKRQTYSRSYYIYNKFLTINHNTDFSAVMLVCKGEIHALFEFEFKLGPKQVA